MYVIVQTTKGDSNAKVVSSHRTLRAAQKAWDKADPFFDSEFMGILTPNGLVNYHGVHMAPSSLGYVTCTMQLQRPDERDMGDEISTAMINEGQHYALHQAIARIGDERLRATHWLRHVIRYTHAYEKRWDCVATMDDIFTVCNELDTYYQQERKENESN